MKNILFLILSLLPFFIFSQDKPTAHYKIYNTQSKKLVSVDDIIKDMTKADVLFFGEEHNDSTAHQLEYICLTNYQKNIRRKLPYLWRCLKPTGKQF
jgi:uncharacterized iron-regulated protein